MTKKATYIFTTYLNASHAIRWAEGLGQAHPHTYEIKYEFHLQKDLLVPFNKIEDGLAAFLQNLNGKFLNDEAPFDKINPTLENLTDYLCDELAKQLTKFDCVLDEITVSASPTRAYHIQLTD
jgi:6-pyruvoyltetrahydropterin/6-carboxytetrahydropterin synthase